MVSNAASTPSQQTRGISFPAPPKPYAVHLPGPAPHAPNALRVVFPVPLPAAAARFVRTPGTFVRVLGSFGRWRAFAFQFGHRDWPVWMKVEMEEEEEEEDSSFVARNSC